MHHLRRPFTPKTCSSSSPFLKIPPQESSLVQDTILRITDDIVPSVAALVTHADTKFGIEHAKDVFFYECLPWNAEIAKKVDLELSLGIYTHGNGACVLPGLQTITRGNPRYEVTMENWDGETCQEWCLEAAAVLGVDIAIIQRYL